MSETISPQEAAELRRRLDLVAPAPVHPLFGIPLDPPLPPEGSWQRQLMDEHERKRQERVEAARIARERMLADQAAAEEAERQRRQRNAPRIAELDRDIHVLRERLAPIEAEFERRSLPIEAEIRKLRSEREALL